MPSYVFQDTLEFRIVEEGDYLLSVVGFNTGYGKGNLKGDVFIELEFACVECDQDARLSQTYHLTVEKMDWKTDGMVRGLHLKAVKGQALELDASTLIKRRGWAHLTIEERDWVDQNGQKKKWRGNTISSWLVDKPVARVTDPEPKPDEDDLAEL